MKVVVAIDSFKGSLTSMEAGLAIKEGIKRVDPETDVKICPLADGGEGTVEALTSSENATKREVQVTGPLGEPITCYYGVYEDSQTAIIEMAQAAGLTLVDEVHRNPLYTTTYGVGEVIKAAIEEGYRKFIVGIGGSATNDGGTGMLSALGFEFLDLYKRPIERDAIGLKDLVEIRTDHVIPELYDCTFRVACDVNNPLCGTDGCSEVFAPQKGGDVTSIKAMDHWLSDYAALSHMVNPQADPDAAGSGAAGGMGFAFRTFTNAVLESGIQIVLEESNLARMIQDADLVITGEGRLDGQTAMGKAPIGVAQLAKHYKKKVIAFAGCVTEDARVLNQMGIDAYFPVLRTVTTLKEAMAYEQAKANLTDTVEQVFRLMKNLHKIY